MVNGVEGWYGFIEAANGDRYVEIRDTEFWSGLGPLLNAWGHTLGVESYLLLDNCIVDMTHWYQTHQQLAFGLLGTDVTGCDITNSYINMGSDSLHVQWFFGDDGFVHSDFTGTRLTGYTNAGGPADGLSAYTSGVTVDVQPTVVPYSAYPHTGDSNYY
jgi:hypothetical protein